MGIPVRKGLEAEDGIGITIPITEEPAHDHQENLVKTADITIIINDGDSQVMRHNLPLIVNTKNTPNTGQQGGGNHENVVNLITQKIIVVVPAKKCNENSAVSD